MQSVGSVFSVILTVGEMRFAVSFDMLDLALCLCLVDIKTPLKAIKTLVTVSLKLDAGTAQQY